MSDPANEGSSTAYDGNAEGGEVDPFLPGSNDSDILTTTFRIYGTLFAISCVAFCFLRRRLRHVYNVRLWVPELQCDLSRQYSKSGIFSWVWQITRFTDEEVRLQCGMDGLCLLRMFSFGLKLCCVGMFNSIWLIPVYVTSPNSPETNKIIDPIAKATVSNIPPHSPRLYAPILASYCVFGFTMYFILKEMDWFARHRHAFLAEKVARNYVIYVRGLPDRLKTPEGLHKFFCSIFSEEAVLDAQIHWHVPQLQRKVQRRGLLLEALQHRVNYERILKKKPPRWQGMTCKGLRRELKSLNSEIPVLIRKIEDDHSSFTNQSTRSNVFEVASKLLNAKDGDPRDGAFVYFRKLTARNAALQMVHAAKPYSIDVSEAPDPQDICHHNVGRASKELQTGRLLSVGAVFALRVLWTIPTAFVASLGKLESLRGEAAFLDRWIDNAPGLVPFCAILAPFVLISLNSALPTLLEFITLLEFPLDQATTIARQFPKLASFMIIQTFFVSALSGSIWTELQELSKDSSHIMDLLANALPGQSTYFMQILLVKTFIGLSMELLRVVPIMKSIVRRCLSPNLTPEERAQKVMFIRPLCDPLYLLHAEVASANVLYFMVFFVYSSTAPLVSWLLLLCFCCLYVAWGHQICCNYPFKPDTGGRLWITFISIVRASTIIGQLTLWAILILKKFPYAIGLMLPLLGINILFNIFIQQKHMQVAQFLPSEHCSRVDSERRDNTDLSFLVDAFKQPAMMASDPVEIPRNGGSKRSRRTSGASTSRCHSPSRSFSPSRRSSAYSPSRSSPLRRISINSIV